MPRIFSLLLPMWSVSCAAPSDSDTHLPSDSDGETASFPETGTVPEPSASLQGRVVDGDGEALEGLQLRVCMDSCVTTATDASGAFSFSTLDVGTHTMQAVSFSSEQDSTPHASVTLAAEEERVLEDWVLPRFETWEVLEDSATLSLDAGLVLYAEPDGLSIGPYSPSSEPIVASVRFDPISSGLPLDELEDSPAAASQAIPPGTCVQRELR